MNAKRCSFSPGSRYCLLPAWLTLELCAALAQAEPLELRPATELVTDGAVLDVGNYAIPCVADWNGDGRPDLLVGYRIDDKVALFANVGTLSQPQLRFAGNVQAGGSDIYVPGSGCGAPAPWVCDYDGDGRRDLLVGSGANGQVFFYRNTNTDAEPILAPGTLLILGNTPLSVSARATPYVCDWDGDSRNDLMSGDAIGHVHFFKNVGSAQEPVYTNDVVLEVGGAPINVGVRSAVRVADWDGDGVPDLLVSASGYVGWCRNLGSAEAPMLAAPVPLQAPVLAGGLAAINTGGRMRLEVTDWNHDGVDDLLIGNWDGTILAYEGYHLAIQSIQRTGNQTVLQWNSAAYLRYDVLGGDSLDDLQTVIATNLPAVGNLTTWTNDCSDAMRFYGVRQAP